MGHYFDVANVLLTLSVTISRIENLADSFKENAILPYETTIIPKDTA